MREGKNMREKLLYKVNEMMYNRAALGWKVPNPANYRYFTIDIYNFFY